MMAFMTADKIYIAGHRRIGASTICRTVTLRGAAEIILEIYFEIDLTGWVGVHCFLLKAKRDQIYRSFIFLPSGVLSFNFLGRSFFIDCEMIMRAYIGDIFALKNDSKSGLVSRYDYTPQKEIIFLDNSKK